MSSSSGITAQTPVAEAEGENARYLRAHVLGLPLHQDLTARHIDYIAEQVGPAESENVVTIELIDTPARFDALQAEWTELLEASGAESPFLTWEWLNAWWTHLRELAAAGDCCGAQRRPADRDCAAGASRGRLPFFVAVGAAGHWLRRF